MYVGTVEYVWVFESDAQAKTLGRDVILYAVRKHRGWVTKLGERVNKDNVNDS